MYNLLGNMSKTFKCLKSISQFLLLFLSVLIQRGSNYTTLTDSF